MAGSDPAPSRGGRFALVAAPVALIAALVAALGQDDAAHEGRRFTPYRDPAGIWTVCAGITGPAVTPGRIYTPSECMQLETAYVRQMLANMGQCVRGEFTFHEAKAWGHFAYNVGTAKFCGSTAARRLNVGERKPVCAEISRWVYVAGKDCRVAANGCGGIVQRRAWERATCEATP